MKKLVIWLFCLTLVFALPIKEDEDNLEDDEHEEDGWFVPQKDGSLKWITEEEAQLKARVMAMSRKKPQEAKVDFYLYTKASPDVPSQLFIGDSDGLENTNFNNLHETRIIIHGWLNNHDSDVNTEIRDAFLNIGSYNVICVDWSDKADRYNYLSATRAIPEIGKRVAEFIEFLRDEGGMENSDLKVIGHSLGAHVAGFAGKTIRGEQIHTIIGLDTAFPLYKYSKCDERLCKTDALYVESIHTNGKLLGFIRPIGHAAFYPNGGKTQPGCGLDISGSCSHGRAYTYYAEAVRKQFLGVKCKGWKYAVKKDCAPTQFGVFDKKGNFLQLEGSFYSPVQKDAPYGLELW